MIGIYDLNICTELSFLERLKIYKECGFLDVALYLDNAYDKKDENYLDIIRSAKSLGLKIKQVHIDYKISNLICDETTDEYFDYVSKKLKEAKTLDIPFVVAHASMSSEPPKISDTQLEKFKDMMESVNGVTLCLENVRNNHNLKRILALNLENVKMCFDLGHAHCYGNEKEVFEEYKEHIICSHLHDNFKKDTHFCLGDGEIDYKEIVSNLKKIENSSNCLECFPEYGKVLNKEEFVAFVKKCYDSVKNL